MPIGVYEHRRIPLAERFWPKVRKTATCWLWTGSRNNMGYGKIKQADRRTMSLAHRVSYELLVGPIPEGMQLDHLCRVRHCVRPDHLEVVTNRENNMRAPHIRERHEATGHGTPLSGMR